ncbi:hypothetical protein XHC_4328 [Xanthomonas hortorum pv. carotae str. M081]|nr:hypothetical protein XHC_4328 [Xanthomonas hortorum pv. carotae str. M081]
MRGIETVHRGFQQSGPLYRRRVGRAGGAGSCCPAVTACRAAR